MYNCIDQLNMEGTFEYDEIATVSKCVDNEYVDLEHVVDTKEYTDLKHVENTRDNVFRGIRTGYTNTSTVYCMVAVTIIVITILSITSGILVYFFTVQNCQAAPVPREATQQGDGSTTQRITSSATTLDLDECARSPCKHGATCMNGQNGYTCTCGPGWTSRDCDTDINECESDPCKNGARCINEINRYLCNCSDGWTSENCDVAIPCPDGWLKQVTSCYFFSDDSKEWNEAMTACINLDGQLVEIHYEAVDDFIRTIARLAGSNFWIGLTDSSKEGEWVWQGSGTNVTSELYTNWSPGQPDDGGNSEDCALIEASLSFMWNDDQCYNKHKYICEKKMY